jgi:hypothetical protein
MIVDRLWDRYAATWSLDGDTREDELSACVAADVTYCDPNGLLQGREALSAYMAAFQASVPGGVFEIRSVLNHHDCSLARWTLHGPDGRALQTGASFGSHADDGRLRAISGFFEPAGEDQPR